MNSAYTNHTPLTHHAPFPMLGCRSDQNRPTKIPELNTDLPGRD